MKIRVDGHFGMKDNVQIKLEEEKNNDIQSNWGDPVTHVSINRIALDKWQGEQAKREGSEKWGQGTSRIY